MSVFTDQLGRQVEIPAFPQKIISLVPSHTELLFDLGLTHEIIGITKFCSKPAEKTKFITKIGGTKQLQLEQIAALNPDLIIANKEENTKSEIEWLAPRFPVWISDIYTLDDALAMIVQAGKLTNRDQEAGKLEKEIRQAFSLLTQVNIVKRLKVAYLIWKDPYMVAAKSTFIDYILTLAGFTNVFSIDRYPVITADQLHNLKPDLIFLSSEPYPFKEKHISEFQSICPKATVMQVDGEMFSWYGSRLKFTPSYIVDCILKKIKL